MASSPVVELRVSVSPADVKAQVSAGSRLAAPHLEKLLGWGTSTGTSAEVIRSARAVRRRLLQIRMSISEG